MGNNLLLVALLIFLSVESFAQQTQLQGKLTNFEEVEGIHVLNHNARTNTVTDAFGNFSIYVKVTDTLVFSSVHYLPKKVAVSEEIVESGIVVVTLEKLVNQLDEVFVGSRLTGDLEKDMRQVKVRKRIDFDSLGIPGYKGEPMEHIPTVIGQTIGLTHVNIEALYNHLSGYYKRLRTQRKWETENNTAARILYKYDEDFFLKTLQLPDNRIYDFILFCMETSTLQSDFKKNNQGRVLEIFYEKAPIYRKRLEQENFTEKKE